MTTEHRNGSALAHRSFSQLKTLRECGEQYRLRYIEKLPRRPSVPAVAGVVIHSATERIDALLADSPKSTKDFLLPDALEVASDALAKKVAEESGEYPPEQWISYGFRPKQDLPWFTEHGIPQAVEAYIDWRLDNPQYQLAEIPGFGLAIEVPFQHYIDGQLVYGFIDRVFTLEDEYLPTDLKSGRKPKTDEQLGLYAAALRKALGWDIKWGLYLYELKKGVAKVTQPPLAIDHWSDEKLDRVYGPATLAIDDFIYIPNPGDACQHCPFSDRCDFAQSVL